MVTHSPSDVIKAKEAADLVAITYRQLDHWARKGWVKPTIQESTGRGGRRLYSIDDVLKLAALRHFGQSGWTINEDLGRQFATLEVGSAQWIVLGSQTGLSPLADSDALHQALNRTELISVFSLSTLRQHLADRDTADDNNAVTPLRRPA